MPELSKETRQVEFELKDLMSVGVMFVVIGVVFAFGLQVLGDIKSDMTSNSAEYNATGQAIIGLAKFPAKMSLIATVIVAALIIGIIIRYLFVKFA